jgi:hypothetical protein
MPATRVYARWIFSGREGRLAVRVVEGGRLLLVLVIWWEEEEETKAAYR